MGPDAHPNRLHRASGWRIPGEVADDSLLRIAVHDSDLGRRGELLVALRERYRAVLARDPGWTDYMRAEGRERELAYAAGPEEAAPRPSPAGAGWAR